MAPRAGAGAVLMQLAGSTCQLRPLRSIDAVALARHADNLNIARQLRDRFPHPYTIDDARTFVELASQPENALAMVGIEVDSEVGGVIGVTIGSDVERYSGEIGYWLGEAYWGRGIVTEAVTLLTDYAFRNANLLRIFALPFAENLPSVRVLEKAGYVLEGRLRSSAVKYGQPRDQLLYARVNRRWAGPAGLRPTG